MIVPIDEQLDDICERVRGDLAGGARRKTTSYMDEVSSLPRLVPFLADSFLGLQSLVDGSTQWEYQLVWLRRDVNLVDIPRYGTRTVKQDALDSRGQTRDHGGYRTRVPTSQRMLTLRDHAEMQAIVGVVKALSFKEMAEKNLS